MCRGGSGAAPARVAEDPPVYVFEDYLSAAEVRRGLADGVGGLLVVSTEYESITLGLKMQLDCPFGTIFILIRHLFACGESVCVLMF